MGIFSKRPNPPPIVEEAEEVVDYGEQEKSRNSSSAGPLDLPTKLSLEAPTRSNFENPTYPARLSRNDSTWSDYTPGRGKGRPSVNADFMSGYSSEDQSEKSFHLRRKWKSSVLAPGEVYEKPWMNEKIPRRVWEKVIFWAGCFVGGVVGGFLIWQSWNSVTNSEYCMILDEPFAGIDPNIWHYEIQRGGYNAGSFEWTTDDPRNIYVDSQGLHIIPTLTVNTTNITETQLENGAILNLTTAGTCTSNDKNACSVRSNYTSGAIINPVRSARINTKNSRAIRYGKVEVIAKMPKGDWIWPSISMYPRYDIYGMWPASGQIDIVGARGNAPGFPGGRDQVSAMLHWGPNPSEDAFWRTEGTYNLPRTDFSEAFHKFGLEWNEKYLFVYLDSRLLQVVFSKFSSGSMWTRGDFSTNTNQSALNDPWSWTGRPNTPFDQEFYLTLDVAVGSTNGWFVDAIGNKPWVDNNPNAPRAFWDSAGTWYPTWGPGDERGMTVQSVKMFSLGVC